MILITKTSVCVCVCVCSASGMPIHHRGFSCTSDRESGSECSATMECSGGTGDFVGIIAAWSHRPAPRKRATQNEGLTDCSTLE